MVKPREDCAFNTFPSAVRLCKMAKIEQNLIPNCVKCITLHTGCTVFLETTPANACENRPPSPNTRLRRSLWNCASNIKSHLLRLVFTSDRVGVGSGVLWLSENQKLEAYAESWARRIQSRKNQNVSIFFWPRLRLRRLRSSENQIVGVGSEQKDKPITTHVPMLCD